jgi:hypothetical protein
MAHDGKRKQAPRVDVREAAGVLDAGTSKEKVAALELLCPCRNRVYDRELWEKIVRERRSDEPGVAHQAEHALGTLLQRAAVDPRSQALIEELEAEAQAGVLESLVNISLWGPRGRPSRRKYMTRCSSGRLKALRSLAYKL